ncbi:MAG: hypothetical protein M3O46_15585 [Myxococcota bacterium]|nr:hypothetical protein [Myxococcota bacterium]
MIRPISAAILIALAPVVFSPPIQAQGAADDPTTAMARARFKEGVEFYDKGEYEQARVAFLQAYALKRHPAVLLNLAWSCLKSGHALEADRYFKQFLAEGRDITEKQRADANDGLAQSRARLGRIDVIAAAGTELTIDGDRVGNAPLAEPLMVEIGAHMVKFKAPDGTTDSESITVLGGEKAVARFKMTTVVPTAPPSAPPSEAAAPPPQATPPAAKERPPEETNRQAEHATVIQPAGAETGGPSVFSTPKNLAPVIILGGVAVVGFVGAGTFLFFKGQAQSKADDLRNQIEAKNGRCPPLPRDAARFQAACDAFSKDISDVNDDAVWGNVFLAGGLVATAGAVVYWLAASKRGDDMHAAAKPIVTPIVGPTVAGLSFSGEF